MAKLWTSTEENKNIMTRVTSVSTKGSLRHTHILEDENNMTTQKSARKSAIDVASCIFWDDSLSAHDFVVGYHDHRKGIVEEIFSTFSWTNGALLDDHNRAVPKNRIRYFKYKGITVWDRKGKIDHVFGSDGSGVTIHDVIEKNTGLANLGDSEQCDPNIDTECDQVNSGIENINESEIIRRRDFYWGKKARPTHFLCIRITDDEILNRIREAHPEITKLHPEYKDCLIPLESLHVTLASLGLDSEDKIQNAVKTLKHMQPQLQAMNPTEIKLHFDSVGQFNNNVVFAKVSVMTTKQTNDESGESKAISGERNYFHDFVSYVRTSMSNAGIEIREVFDFHPHMTIIKMKKRHCHEFRTHVLDTARIFDILHGVTFGSQCLDAIHLCEMSEDRAPDGFYKTPCHVSFSV